MRASTVVCALTIVSLALAAPAALGGDPLAIGASWVDTDVEMMDVSGSKVSIARARGENGTLVLFTCNACPWVKAWEERIVAIGNAALDRGVGVIAINSNDPNKVAEDDYPVMQERAKERGVRFPYVVDATSDVARSYGATRTPEAFLFDADGKLVYHGAIDDNAKDASAVEERFLQDAVEAVAIGEAVPVAETKALGCTIKFR